MTIDDREKPGAAFWRVGSFAKKTQPPPSDHLGTTKRPAAPYWQASSDGLYADRNAPRAALGPRPAQPELPRPISALSICCFAQFLVCEAINMSRNHHRDHGGRCDDRELARAVPATSTTVQQSPCAFSGLPSVSVRPESAFTSSGLWTGVETLDRPQMSCFDPARFEA